MRQKIIDDYWVEYLNDLFEIKLNFLRSELNIAIFCFCMDATFFSKSRPFLNNFLIIDATDRSKISSDKSNYFSP